MIRKNYRETVKVKYDMPDSDYDQQRLVETKGAFLSRYDIRLFEKMFPNMQDSDAVLEIGSGTGRFTMPALKKAKTIIATDINTSLLEGLHTKLVENQFHNRCSIKTEDVFNLSFPDNSFDLIYSIHVIPRLMSLADQTAALKEIIRVIKPNGKLLFNYRNKRSLYGIYHKDFAPTSAEIDSILLNCGCKVLQKRGKWLISRKVLDVLPSFACSTLAYTDEILQRFAPDFAWDVFVLATKC